MSKRQARNVDLEMGTWKQDLVAGERKAASR
jgi:hypothetical protein